MPPGDWIANGFNQLIRSDEPTSSGQVACDPAPAGLSDCQAKAHEAFVNYYIHQVNLLRHLFGESYQVTYADPCGVTMHVQSASDVPGLLEMAPWSNAIDWQETALICYDKGWIRLRLCAPLTLGRAGEVECYEDGGNNATPITRRPTMPWIGAMQNQATLFITAVQGEPTNLCGAADALADLRIADDYIRLVTAAQAKHGRA